MNNFLMSLKGMAKYVMYIREFRSTIPQPLIPSKEPVLMKYDDMVSICNILVKSDN